MNNLSGFIAQLTPGAVGVWTGVLMFAGWLLHEYRATRKLSADDRLARREGYARQVTNLQRENRSLRRDLTELRREYDDYRHLCHTETDQLRNQVIGLENDLAGLKRGIAAESVALARRLGISKD